MKSANPSAPRVIFVVGIPGAGKTFFAERFSENFGAPFVETDQLRRILTDDPSYSPEEDLVVNEIGVFQLKLLMQTKKTIIYEGGTEARTDRQELIKLIRKNGYEPVVVWVQTDSATSKRRATKGTRGHSKATLLPGDRYEYLYSRFTPPNEAEKAVVISGKHTSSSQVKVVLKQLIQNQPKSPPVAPIESQPPQPNRQRPSTITRPTKPM